MVAESEPDEDEAEYGNECDILDEEELGGNLKMTRFIMKNGCCKDCMKALSKSGKVSIN